ncbi:MAG: hypothetical protein KDB52_11360 [Solirubrobacterales bacterium]|nr:hypothetical protein [Solirubrobacterales bacterium]
MDQLMQARPSPSMAVALVALFIALAGTAFGGPKKGEELPKNSVGTEQLKEGAVKTSDLGRNSVVASVIKPNAVDTTDLKPGAVTATDLAPKSVTTGTIGPGAVLPGTIAPGAVTETALAAAAVSAGKIKDQAITETKIGPGAVTAPAIGPEAITSGKIGPEAIIASKIEAGAIIESKIADAAVKAGKIDEGAVISSKIGPGAVTNQKIDDGAVKSAKIEDGAVGSSKIEGGAVIAGKLGQKVVNTPQISDAIPSSSASKTTATTFTNGGYTALTYPTTLFDSAGLHTVSYRMSAPVDGIYQVTAVATWENDSCGGTRSLEFNGREPNGFDAFLPSPRISSTVQANMGATTTQTLSGMVKLTAGQGIEIWGGGSGMSCANTDVLGNPASSLTMTWVAPGPS